ncbi:MAG: hypothetical protein H6834_12405 [Planctomycetes bacterium]|nr:hypothetical protein [Planctomycetota bacterium]
MPKTRHVVHAILMAILLLAPGFAQGRLYTVSPRDADLRIVDPTTGVTGQSVTMTWSGGDVSSANGLTYDPSTRTLFAIIKLTPTGGVTERHLATINPTTGEITSIGDLGDNFANLTLTDAGTMFGITGDGATTPETIFTIDPTNAMTTLFLARGIGNDGETLAFNPSNGLLYHASGRNGQLNDPAAGPNLETIDPVTMAVNAVTLSGFASDEFLGMIALPNGNLLVANLDNELLTIDGAAVITMTVTTDHQIKGFAWIPEFGEAATGKVQVGLDFSKPDKDKISIKAKGLALHPNFVAANSEVSITLGTETLTVTLDEKGKFKDGTSKVAFKQEASGTWAIAVSRKNGNFSASMAAFGLTNMTGEALVDLPIQVATPEDRTENILNLAYKAKMDKKGKAKG